MSMNLICMVPPQNDNNVPETFKYFNPNEILKALDFFNKCTTLKMFIHLTCK